LRPVGALEVVLFLKEGLSCAHVGLLGRRGCRYAVVFDVNVVGFALGAFGEEVACKGDVAVAFSIAGGDVVDFTIADTVSGASGKRNKEIRGIILNVRSVF